MKLLLDTHVLLWAVEDDQRLAPRVRDLIDSPAHTVFVSAATTWEIAIKEAKGKLKVPASLEAGLAKRRFEPLPITISQGFAAGALPRHHDDPFDRMLVAQARLEGLTLVTSDAKLHRYDVALLNASPSTSESSA